jgi:hypothetical protein
MSPVFVFMCLKKDRKCLFFKLLIIKNFLYQNSKGSDVVLYWNIKVIFKLCILNICQSSHRHEEYLLFKDCCVKLVLILQNYLLFGVHCSISKIKIKKKTSGDMIIVF